MSEIKRRRYGTGIVRKSISFEPEVLNILEKEKNGYALSTFLNSFFRKYFKIEYGKKEKNSKN